MPALLARTAPWFGSLWVLRGRAPASQSRRFTARVNRLAAANMKPYRMDCPGLKCPVASRYTQDVPTIMKIVTPAMTAISCQVESPSRHAFHLFITCSLGRVSFISTLSAPVLDLNTRLAAYRGRGSLFRRPGRRARRWSVAVRLWTAARAAASSAALVGGVGGGSGGSALLVVSSEVGRGRLVAEGSERLELDMAGAVVMRTSGGLVQRNPTGNRISALLAALSRNDSIILERVGSSNSNYIQVWLRPDGVFQLEYRAGQPSEHYQTRTDSRCRVVSALSGWIDEESAWRDDFEWLSIGNWFNRQQ